MPKGECMFIWYTKWRLTTNRLPQMHPGEHLTSAHVDLPLCFVIITYSIIRHDIIYCHFPLDRQAFKWTIVGLFSRNDSRNILVQHFIGNIYALSQNICGVCQYEIVELMIKWILIAKIYSPSYSNVNNYLFSYISVAVFKWYDRRFRFYY